VPYLGELAVALAEDLLAGHGDRAAGGRQYNTTMLRWARWARAEVEAWPDDLSELDVTAGFSRIVSAASRPWPDQETE